MDPVPAATSLARALMALGRARATGVLEVRAPGRLARLAVVEGAPRAVALDPSDAETLGDVLAAQGALDREAHARALAAGLPAGPVGDWLVASGAATRAAVRAALRVQLERRVGRLFEWAGAELRFRGGSTDVGAAPVDEALGTGEMVLGAMRHAVADVPAWTARRRLGDGVLVLSRLGEALVDGAPLWPEESAMLGPLRAGAAVDVILAAAGQGGRAVRCLYALRLLSAAAPPAAGGRAYGVLLRKRRQLRQAATRDDPALLDLPPGARAPDARRALRRLAQEVHPDRFGERESPAVRAASREVMSALVAAVDSLARRSPR